MERKEKRHCNKCGNVISRGSYRGFCNHCKMYGNTNAVRRKVAMYDLSGKFLKRFSSLYEASVETNISLSTIQANVSGKVKHPKYYLFKYDEN